METLVSPAKPSNFLRSMVTGEGSRGSEVSTAHVCIVAVFSFILGVGVMLALKIQRPITVAEYSAFLAASGAFIASTCAPLYLINRGAEVVNLKTTMEGDCDKPHVGDATSGS